LAYNQLYVEWRIEVAFQFLGSVVLKVHRVIHTKSTQKVEIEVEPKNLLRIHKKRETTAAI